MPGPKLVALADAKALPFADGSVHAAITSPPYFGLRGYGDSDNEFGRHSLNEYISEMRVAAREVHRVLRPDGVFWLNVGDTANKSGGAGGDYNKGGRKHGRTKWRQGDTGLKGSQWCLVPHRLVLALQEDGWLVRAMIVWDKMVPRPEDLNHVRRPLIHYEHLFMLAKTKDYRFFHRTLPETGDVWHIKPAANGSRNGDVPPFPEELARRCIVASTEPGDVVLDPFVGSGTTVRVARRLRRRAVGCDLYPEWEE